MSAKRSQFIRDVKKDAKRMEGYQERLERQIQIINRLQQCLVAYGDGLEEVVNAGNVREARSSAGKALNRGKVILAVPKN